MERVWQHDKFVQKYKTHSPIHMKHLFLVSTITFLSLIIIPGLNPPISMSNPQLGSGIVGVEFTTSTIITSISETTVISLIILLSIIILANIETYFILFKSNHYFLKYKLMPIIAIIFFVLYICIFFYSTVNVQSQNIQKTFFSPKLEDTSMQYYDIINKIDSKKISKFSPITLKYPSNYSLTINLLKEDINTTHYNAYALINVNNNDKTNKFEIDKINEVYFENTQDFKNHKFTNYQTSLIYPLGLNNPIITAKEIGKEEIRKYIGTPILIKNPSANLIIESLRLFFTIIFYLFGTIAFVRYFLKEKILD